MGKEWKIREKGEKGQGWFDVQGKEMKEKGKQWKLMGLKGKEGMGRLGGFERKRNEQKEYKKKMKYLFL